MGYVILGVERLAYDASRWQPVFFSFDHIVWEALSTPAVINFGWKEIVTKNGAISIGDICMMFMVSCHLCWLTGTSSVVIMVKGSHLQNVSTKQCFSFCSWKCNHVWFMGSFMPQAGTQTEKSIGLGLLCTSGTWPVILERATLKSYFTKALTTAQGPKQAGNCSPNFCCFW